ncbi:MAG: hypothetical protein Q4F49_06680 [Pseudoxanthomonas suwonensis]|nr:hypothetical protein [Pseudoxanthomonas suwonensis]
MTRSGAGSHGLARAVSIVLHPFAVFAVSGLFATARLAPQQLPRAGVGLLLAIVCVGLYIRWRYRRGDWQTVDASDRRDRPALYLLLLGVGLALGAWLGGWGSPIGRGVGMVTVMLAIAAVLNRWIKLSLHAACLGFAVPVLWGFSPVAGGVAAALLPLLGWSRLALRRHRLDEVVGGAGLGLLTGICALLA